MKTKIRVELPQGGFRKGDAAEIVHDSGLVDTFSVLAEGPFGPSALAMGTLEALLEALDLGICAWERLEGQIREDMQDVSSFVLPTLQPEHVQLLSTFGWITASDAFLRRMEALAGLPPVEGQLDFDGLEAIVQLADDPKLVFVRLLRLGRAWVELKVPATTAPEAAPQALAAYFVLLKAALIHLSENGSARALFAALAHRDIEVAGYPYKGLHVRGIESDATGLLNVRVDQVVGNDQYLKAGMRLARDVAGFDISAHSNPKRVNPILFGLGRPGCGKTVTAHALGNYFLEFCRDRNIPAKFVVVRRTDWASSYQNASANNLVRLFREEVYGFEGVCGVYWPDIDTAFASRDSDQLRSEEKNNLAAVFGIFDGTLIPRDGKWFMICDANNMHMDEATISRIAQNPYTVAGPETPADYVRLLRDVLLKDVAAMLPNDEATWTQIGDKLVHLNLSGRNLDSVAGNIRAEIQDFEYPEDYFKADSARRAEIVQTLGRSVSAEQIHGFIDHFVTFQREAEERDEAERFDREVDTIVRRLNASKKAAERTLEAQ
ncbi:MAG: AAA family ATPase [bacterium]